jgi:hypothetical protein
MRLTPFLLWPFGFVTLAVATSCGSEDTPSDTARTGLSQRVWNPPGSPVFFGSASELGHLETFLGVKSPPSRAFVRRALKAVGEPLVAQDMLSLLGRVGDSSRGFSGSLALDEEKGKTTAWQDLSQVQTTELGSVLHDWRLYHKGLPVEHAQIKEQLEGGNAVFAQGNVPVSLLKTGTAPGSTEAFAISKDSARDGAAWRLNFHPWRLSSASPVYLADEYAFIPAYRFTVDSDASLPGRGPAFPLSILVDGRTGEILEQVTMAFHVDGKALLFEENAVVDKDTGRKETVLPALAGTGERLGHALFNVYSCNKKEVTSECVQSAKGNPGGDFRGVEYESPNYDEVVAFHAVTKSMAWYRRLMAAKPNSSRAWGSNYPGPRSDFGIAAGLTLGVYVRSLTKSPSGYTLDNAAYMPSALAKGSQARILIGTGWEEGQAVEQKRILRYLGRDTDVVMHEFGHHMIYRTLRDVSGQGGALHEGFADYFTYAITGNNRLGESIVSSGESLRSGNRPGKVDPYVNAKAHIAGEFWSSVMWELRQNLGPWKDGFFIFDKIVWESIDLFKEDAGYYDVISALARSAELFAASEGRSATDIKEAMFAVFYARGYIEEPTGNGILFLLSATKNLPSKQQAMGANLGTNAESSLDWTPAKRARVSLWLLC